MNLSRISRQLRREATAHPKKAAILGLLCLVAVWKWVPLACGWINEDDPAAKAPVVVAAVNPVPQPLAGLPSVGDKDVSPNGQTGPGAAPNKPDDPKHPWHQLVRWMDNDPRTLATNPGLGRRDPFLIAQAEPAEDDREKPTPAATPEALGMVLSGTIVGPHRRVAQINGQSYRQGQTVKLAKDGQQIEFTLSAVFSRRVVLRRNGEQFELTIPEPARAGRIELVGGGN